MKPNLENTFSQIYASDEWTLGSGPGSQLPNVQPYLRFLVGIMETHDIKNVLDVGCGDWAFSKTIDWSKVRYTGIDVVPSIINSNISKYQSEKVRFYCTEVSDREMGSHDLVIIKDVFQHLSYSEISKILNAVRRVPYLLITNDFCENNVDCKTGEWRPLNMSRPPFNFIPESQIIFPSSPHVKISQFIRQTGEPRSCK